MPVEFQVPSLRVQVKARLPEAQSEQYQLKQLLGLFGVQLPAVSHDLPDAPVPAYHVVALFCDRV